MGSDEFVEVVYLFDAGVPVTELRLSEFEHYIERQTPVPGVRSGAGVCRGVYAIVGEGLQIKGLVFFLVQVDQRGCVDPNFNVPLAYLVKSAGPGPDFGAGRVPLACRGDCPVPWHANNLWDPLDRSRVAHGGADPATAVHQLIQANALEINPRRIQAPPGVSATRAKPVSEQAAAINNAVQLALVARIEELTRQQAATLLALQSTHEDELNAQAQMFGGQIKVYKLEVARLKQMVFKLVGQQGPGQTRSGLG